VADQTSVGRNTNHVQSPRTRCVFFTSRMVTANAHAVSAHTCPAARPAEKDFEMQYERGSKQYEREVEIGQAFLTTHFRKYFDLDPLATHHQYLGKIASQMSDLKIQPSEIRKMLLGAREVRLHRNGKTSPLVNSTDLIDVSHELEILLAAAGGKKTCKSRKPPRFSANDSPVTVITQVETATRSTRRDKPKRFRSPELPRMSLISSI
jgi:hypothetical protein